MSLHKDLAKIAEYIEGNLSSIGMRLNVSAESIEHAVEHLRNEALRKSGDYRDSNPLVQAVKDGGIKIATFYKDFSLIEFKDGQIINNGGPDNIIIFEEE